MLSVSAQACGGEHDGQHDCQVLFHLSFHRTSALKVRGPPRAEATFRRRVRRFSPAPWPVRPLPFTLPEIRVYEYVYVAFVPNIPAVLLHVLVHANPGFETRFE